MSKQLDKYNWEEDILKSCISAERMYLTESDQTPESWYAIYNANVIEKIKELISNERKKIIDRITDKYSEKINEIYVYMGFGIKDDRHYGYFIKEIENLISQVKSSVIEEVIAGLPEKRNPGVNEMIENGYCEKQKLIVEGYNQCLKEIKSKLEGK